MWHVACRHVHVCGYMHMHMYLYLGMCVGMCGHVWAYVGICGHVWACVGMCGHVWAVSVCDDHHGSVAMFIEVPCRALCVR